MTECLTCKSTSPLKGDAWMRDQLVRLKALMQTPDHERAAALRDFCGGDARLFKEMYGGIVTTKDAQRPPTFDDFMGGLSVHIVARGGRP